MWRLSLQGVTDNTHYMFKLIKINVKLAFMGVSLHRNEYVA